MRFMVVPINRAARRRRFVTFDQLKPDYGIPHCRVHIDRLIKQGRFPKKVHISANRVGWFSDELEALLEERGAARDAKTGASDE